MHAAAIRRPIAYPGLALPTADPPGRAGLILVVTSMVLGAAILLTFYLKMV